MAQLARENEQQKEQFIHIAERVDQITKKVSELRNFDHKLKVMVNLDTSGRDTQVQGVGGSAPLLLQPRHTAVDGHKELVRLTHHSLDNLDNEIELGQQDKTELHKFLKNQKMLLASTPSIWPTKGWLSSRFGNRISPFTGEEEFHKGIDISSRMKVPIVATADGIVSSIASDHGYGRNLFIKHGYGLVTRYAHLEKALVKKGQYVKRGETVALVGSTGKSTGPHLHYEVHLNRVPVNPLRYILN
jgi:murein DD-endopeptidase MepM/ murein hydrolase activator NlpD